MSGPRLFGLDFEPAFHAAGPLRDRVAILVERQRALWDPERSSWVTLPWVRDGELCWLLVASDAEGERRGREVVQGFVGPAVACAEPGRVVTSPAGDAHTALLEAHRGPTLVVRRVGAEASLLDALELMIAVRAGEPTLRRAAADPLGFLLRDFHLALSNGDPDASERLLERLEDSGLLASENLRFLRVERLARLARWHELGALPWFTDLARSRRPRHVTEHLLEALWRRDFDDATIIAEPGAALRRFEERDLGGQYRSLLDAVDVPVSNGGRRLVWLASITTNSEARADRVLASVDQLERNVLLQIASRGGSLPQPLKEQAPLDRARALMDGGDFVAAVETAEATPTDRALVAIAVRAAFELSDAELADRAVTLVDAVGEDALPTTPGFVSNLRHIRRLALNRCSGWVAWLRRTAAAEPWPDAADVARGLSLVWDTGELRQHSAADGASNDLLAAAEGVNGLHVTAVLDLICDVASEVADALGAASFTDAALLVLSMQENPSLAVRNAFFSLTADVLAVGPVATRYADLVKTATVLWEKVQARETFTWALDLADVFAANPSPDPAARAAFITSVGIGISEFAARVPSYERSLLEALAEECGTAVALPPLPLEPADVTDLDIWTQLSGKVVGLYSLLGGVGVRFAERIHLLNAEAKVKTNADTQATDALRHLALSADFLVVDTRHAAHEATGQIDKVRPRGRQLFPSGKGVSSFVAAIREALERDRGSA